MNTLLTVVAALGLIASARAETIFVGTYTNTTSRGIYAVSFDPGTGHIGQPVLAAAVTNPSFLAVSPDGKTLYAVDESARGKVNAFAIGPRLTLLGSQSTNGNGPAHLALDPTGRVAIAANYGGGSIASFPLLAGGTLGPAASFIEHRGTLGPDKTRQKAPHPHSVTFSKDGRFAFVCDLGLDRVLIYRVDAASGSITPSTPAGAAVPPGTGARHSVFSPDGRWLYVLNEMGGSVCVFAWNEFLATLELSQTISTLPQGYAGPTSSAEIALSPDGRFLYASNRGPNNIAVFARDGSKGTLRFVNRQSCGGIGPRNFVVSPNGQWLICANQQSNDLTVFKVDAATGRFAPAGRPVRVPRPVCLVCVEN